MQKIILILLTFFNISAIRAQMQESLLGKYEYKDQTGLISTLVLKSDSFIYRSFSMLENSEVRGVWEVEGNLLFLQSNLQLSNRVFVKEKKTKDKSVSIHLQDRNGIALGFVPVVLNKEKKHTYISDALGRIQVPEGLDIEHIAIQYLSYPTIRYKIKNPNFNLFKITFLLPTSTLYRFFEGEMWEIRKNMLIDSSEGFQKKYRKK